MDAIEARLIGFLVVSYAPLKSASHTREGSIAFLKCLHSAPFAVSLGAGVKMNGALVIPARVEIPHCPDASRNRLLAKIQLTAL